MPILVVVGTAGVLPFGSLRGGIAIRRRYDITDVSDGGGRDCLGRIYRRELGRSVERKTLIKVINQIRYQ